jgi:hypothetical protein
MNKSEISKPPPWVIRLGYAGLLPFCFGAAGLWLLRPEHGALAGLALAGYGATIASFLGAIHWGLAMREPHASEAKPYIWGVTPSLVAGVALLVTPVTGLLTLTLLLWACYAIDRKTYPDYQLQHWLPMRLRLTVVASLSCLAGAAALLG